MRKWLCFVALACISCSSSLSAHTVSRRVRATPSETGHASVTVSQPKPDVVVHTAAVAAPIPFRPRPVPYADLSSFHRLGSWIDIFDYSNKPASIRPLVADMAKLGTKTLYLETARSDSSSDIAFPAAVGAALDEAKPRGMKVVAWYPPDLANVGLDVRRSVAAVNFRTNHGHRFDGFAADIEYTGGVRDDALRSARAVDYSNKLRRTVGKLYPMGAIVIPPTSLQINPARWPNFPWKGLATSYDVFMPMNYWTAYAKDAATATDLTQRNVLLTHSLTGKPVHIIGGLGEDSDIAQVRAFVAAARATGSIGGSLYDFRTTRSSVWGELRRFNA